MANEKRLIGFGKGFKHGYFYKPWRGWSVEKALETPAGTKKVW